MGQATTNPLAKGFYTVPEAVRLIGLGNSHRVYGWLRGYTDRQIGPLLNRDYSPVGDSEELSFLDLMEVRFVEHFREHGVKVRSLRIAAKRLREEFKTDHPFALERVVLLADKADVFVDEVLKESAEEAGDPRLRSLLTHNYVMYEAIKQVLVPGIEFDAKTRLARAWRPRPKKFPDIIVDPRIAYGQPVGPSKVPTATLFDAWKAEKESTDAVAFWYQIPTAEVIAAVKFEKHLNRYAEVRAA
jgi:uncharacterized protein (DUF433 family)